MTPPPVTDPKPHSLTALKVLILGGTTEASTIAHALADAGIPAILSYAGRTAHPAAQPVPVRVGGFGGAQGLAAWLAANAITRVIDATHPFAAQISRNAIDACAAQDIPLTAFERPPWRPGPGDIWTHVPDVEAAARSLPPMPERVFLAIGRQTLAAFACAPHHHYLLRLVDPPTSPLPLPHVSVEIARGPFDPDNDRALLQRHRITRIIAKNAGGTGANAKLLAARALGIPVTMIDRPTLGARDTVDRLDAVMARLHDDLGV